MKNKMRSKINFTEEVKQFITNEYNNGASQKSITESLLKQFNIKCSEKTIYRLYKELGLNGNKKAQRGLFSAWHDIFTNDEFPNKITNSIILDLCYNWRLDEIAEEHNTKVDILLKYIDPKSITSDVKRRFLAYKRLYEYKDKTDLRVFLDYEREAVCNELNKRLDGKAHIEMNYKTTICGKEYTFDLYCPEAKCLLLTAHGGTLYPIINVMKRIGINAFQLKGFTYEGELIKVFDLNDKINDIDNLINNILKGVDVSPKRHIDPKPFTENQIDYLEEKMIVKRIISEVTE